MSIKERVNYLSTLIKYDLKNRGKIGSYIQSLIFEDFKLTQDEWDNLEETRQFVIQEATKRFSQVIEKESV